MLLCGMRPFENRYRKLVRIAHIPYAGIQLKELRVPDITAFGRGLQSGLRIFHNQRGKLSRIAIKFPIRPDHKRVQRAHGGIIAAVLREYSLHGRSKS
jgi:hypothetical protein